MDPTNIELTAHHRRVRLDAKERIDLICKIEAEKAVVLQQAQEAIDAINAMSGIIGDQTPIIIFGYETDEELGDYARVGQIIIEGKVPTSGKKDQRVVTIKMGAAFSSLPAVSVATEVLLGMGVDNRSWHGIWDTDNIESTNSIDGITNDLKAISDSSATQREKAKIECNLRAVSMRQSIAFIWENAENSELNPKSELIEAES